MSIKRLALLTTVTVAVVLTATACTLFGPSQAERDMGKTIEVYRVLEEHYVDRNNLDVTALNEGAVSGLLEGLDISSEGFDPRVILSTMEIEDLDGLLAVYESLEDSYFSRDDVDLEALNERALISMLAALDDPFTGYHAPRAYSHVTGELIDGTFSGIGAEVTMVDGLPTIVSPLPDSPAERAGVLAGDVLIEVDGTPLAGLSLWEAIDLVRGPKGSIAKITMRRPGADEPILFEIERDTIERQTVEVYDLGGVARVRLSHFTNPSDEQLERALQELKEQETRGIILDLRNNPGGVIDSVVNVVSEFFEDGLVMYEINADGERTDHEVREGGLAVDTPMVVLVNAGSASGSEVVAGAFQSRGRAKVVGLQTFGKGVVNLPIQLSDGSGVFVTIARWYTPTGQQIGSIGVAPDVVVAPIEGQDVQLAVALDLLRTEIAERDSALPKAS